jgi:hypothetical protein
MATIAARTAGVVAPVVLSFLVSTIILLALSKALSVNVEVGRWQSLLSISLVFTIFSVWLGHRAKGPTPDFSYAQSSLALAIGALSSIGGQVGRAWFSHFDGEPVAENASVLGVMLDRATPFADVIYLALVNITALMGCVICFFAAGVVRGRSELTAAEQSRLFGAAIVLLIANIMLQGWVKPTAAAQHGAEPVWLVVVLFSLTVLFALFRWLSSETPRLSFAIAQTIGEAAGARVVVYSNIVARLVWGVIVGAARAFLVLVVAASVLSLIAGAFNGVTGLVGAASAGVYSAFRLAAPLNVAALPLLIALMAGLALLVIAPSLSTPPISAATRRSLSEALDRVSALSRLARAAVAPTTLVLLIAFFAAIVFANLPSFENTYTVIDATVRSHSQLELARLSNATERTLFMVLAFGFVGAAFASLALVAVAFVVTLTIVAASLGRAAHKIGRRSGDGLVRWSQDLADAVGALLVAALGTLLRSVAGLAIALAIGLGLALLVGLARRIISLPPPTLSSPPPVQTDQPVEPLGVDPAVVTLLWFVAAGVIVAISWRPLLQAWRIIRGPLTVLVRTVIVAALFAAITVAATPAYMSLVGQLSHLGDVIGVNLSAWLVIATDALSQFPPLAARLLIVFAFAAIFGLSILGGVSLIILLSIPVLVRLGVSVVLIGRAIGAVVDAVVAVIGGVSEAIPRIWRSIDWRVIGGAIWRPIPWLAMLGVIIASGWYLVSHPALIDAFVAFALGVAPYAASALVIAAAFWLTWRLRRILIAAGPRLVAIAAVILIVFVASLPRPQPASAPVVEDQGTPLIPEAKAEDMRVPLSSLQQDDSARWVFDSARYLATERGVVVAEAGVSIDHQQVCSARTVIVVGAASSEGSPIYNRALARCRAARVAEIIVRISSSCETAPRVWLLNLGARSSSDAGAEDRLPAIIALNRNGPFDEPSLTNLLAQQSADFSALLQNRPIAEYADPEWKPWSHPEARAQANDLLRACEGLGR